VPLLGRKDFEAAWLRLCRIGTAPTEVYTRDKTTGNEGADAQFVPWQSGSRLAAYAYAKTKNLAFAKMAVTEIAQRASIATTHLVSGSDSLHPVEEDPWISTNDAAQSGLVTIQVLELCRDQLPTEAPVRPVRDFRGPGGPGGPGDPRGRPGPAAPR